MAEYPKPCAHCQNPTPHTTCCCYFPSARIETNMAEPTPTPGDLNARLREIMEAAREVYRISEREHVAWHRLRDALDEAAAALSALPAAGGAQSELRALAHDMGAFLNANRASLPSKVIQDSYALHNRLNALAWATTPQPSAAEIPSPLGDWHEPAIAAVGAQGDDDDDSLGQMLEYVDACAEKLANKGCPIMGRALKTIARRLAAPAARKGVDDAMVERACRAFYGGRWDRVEMESPRRWMRAALEAALTRQPGSLAERLSQHTTLTRQPVAGDGK